jgi:hypothetical protein
VQHERENQELEVPAAVRLHRRNIEVPKTTDAYCSFIGWPASSESAKEFNGRLRPSSKPSSQASLKNKSKHLSAAGDFVFPQFLPDLLPNQIGFLFRQNRFHVHWFSLCLKPCEFKTVVRHQGLNAALLQIHFSEI